MSQIFFIALLSLFSGYVLACSEQCTCPDSSQIGICVISECVSLDFDYINQLTIYGQLCPYLRNYLLGRYGYVTLYDDLCHALPRCRYVYISVSLYINIYT